MGHCWSCGSEVYGGLRYPFTCPTCETVEGIKSLRSETANNLGELARIQQQGFERLYDSIEEIGSVLEWGFTELSWRLRQQTQVLNSIDYTLKTPNETQAKELRQMAEELRKRGVIEESEKRFLKSIDLNPLDYRSYVGLALTYLHMGKFDESKTFLEKSIPHAPKEKEEQTESISGVVVSSEVRKLVSEGNMINAIKVLRGTTGQGLKECKDAVDEIKARQVSILKTSLESVPIFDWKSYSYKLIGRIFFCQNNYTGAVEALKHSIQLSPKYADSYYDYAQYCALSGKAEDCLASLKTAIMEKPFFHDWASKEKNFDLLRNEVQQLRASLMKEALDRANLIISKCENDMKQIDQQVSRAKVAQSQLEDTLRKWESGWLSKNKPKTFAARDSFEKARLYLDSAAMESNVMKEQLKISKQVIESKNYANIVALEATKYDKPANRCIQAASAAEQLIRSGLT